MRSGTPCDAPCSDTSSTEGSFLCVLTRIVVFFFSFHFVHQRVRLLYYFLFSSGGSRALEALGSRWMPAAYGPSTLDHVDDHGPPEEGGAQLRPGAIPGPRPGHTAAA